MGFNLSTRHGGEIPCVCVCVFAFPSHHSAQPLHDVGY